MEELNPQTAPKLQSGPLPLSSLDLILTTQILIGWAGESSRLGWWQTDLASEYGGEDLFRRLLPATWRWAILQSVREAARRADEALRGKSSDPDRLLTLFHLGFTLDEKLDERLRDLKRSLPEPALPVSALPGLAELIEPGWGPGQFAEWVRGHGGAVYEKAPAGRELPGEPPASPELQVRRLVAALEPLPEKYPMPYFRRAAG